MSGIQKFTITDSRGVRWNVIVSGPTGIGHKGHTDREEIWFARYGREGLQDEITVELHSPPDVDEAELQTLLELQPEWEYKGWVRL